MHPVRREDSPHGKQRAMYIVLRVMRDAEVITGGETWKTCSRRAVRQSGATSRARDEKRRMGATSARRKSEAGASPGEGPARARPGRTAIATNMQRSTSMAPGPKKQAEILRTSPPSYRPHARRA